MRGENQVLCRQAAIPNGMLPGGLGTDDDPGACIVEDVEFRLGKPFLEFCRLVSLGDQYLRPIGKLLIAASCPGPQQRPKTEGSSRWAPCPIQWGGVSDASALLGGVQRLAQQSAICSSGPIDNRGQDDVRCALRSDTPKQVRASVLATRPDFPRWRSTSSPASPARSALDAQGHPCVG